MGHFFTYNTKIQAQTSKIKISASVLLIVGTIVDLAQGFIFFGRSSGGCTNCSSFVTRFFSCGRILGPSVGKRRRRRFAPSTKEEYNTKNEDLLMSLYEKSRLRFDHQ